MKRCLFTIIAVACLTSFCFSSINTVSDTTLLAIDVPVLIYPPRTITGLKALTIINSLPEKAPNKV